MNPPLTVFAILAAGLSFIAVQAVTQNRTPQRIVAPGTNQRPENLTFNVDLPPIATLAHYYGEGSDSWAPFNPFVPPEKRLNEVAMLRNPPPKQPPKTTIVIPPRPSEPPPPPPKEPSIAPLDLAALQLPEVIGGFIHQQQPVIVVLQGDTPAVLAVGETYGEWTLRRVDSNSAWFTHGDKPELTRVAIGMSDGDTAMTGNTGKTQAGAPAIVPSAPPPSSPRDENAARGEGDNSQRGDRRSRGDGGRFSFRDPRVRQVLRENPDFFDIIRDNPTEAQRLINEALEQQEREQQSGGNGP